MRFDLENPPVKSANDAACDGGFAIVKFGARADLVQAVTEIYSHMREGRKVAAFVADQPEALAEEAKAAGLDALVLHAPSGGRLRSDLMRRDVVIIKGAAGSDPVGAVASQGTREKLRVAVAGLGLIGEGAALRLGADNPDYALCAALVREPFRERPHIKVDQLTNDLSALLAVKPDVVIDALPSGTAGNTLIRAALERGVSVVTANKQAIAGSMRRFTDLAAETGAAFRYSPSVGGGAPLVETLARARKLGEIDSAEAVLNGTVNYILTALSQGDSFEDAIRAAQEAGFAEPDPSADLSGADAKAKLAIVAFAAFGEEIDLDRIEVEGLDPVKAARFVKAGGSWKQLARIGRDASGALSASVRFERRDGDPLFAGALGEANALRIRLVDGRTVECRGKGAGRRPTVESILGDLGSIRRDKQKAAARTAITPDPILA